MDKTPLRVLIVEDSVNDADLAVLELSRGGFAVAWTRVDTPADFDAALSPDLDIILSDYVMPHFDGLRALHMLQQRGFPIPFLLVSGTIGEDTAVAAMRAGATDYLLKDRLARLAPAVRLALSQKQARTSAEQAETALRQSEARFRALVENSSDAVLLMDANAVVSYLTPASTRILGYPLETLIGRSLFPLLNPADDAKARAAVNTWLQSPNQPIPFQLRFTHQTGQPVWIEAIGHNLLADPAIQALVINYRDISERVQRERELEALSQLSASLRQAQTRAEMLPIILDHAVNLLNAAGASLDLRDAATRAMVVEQARGDWASLVGHRMGPDEGINGHVMATGQTYVSADVSHDPRFMAAAFSANTPAVIAVPLKARDVPIGVLWAGRRQPFGADEARLLTAVADLVASAIYRATLHEQTETRLQRLSTLRMIDMAINASLDLQVTLNVLLSQATRQLNVHAATILLYERQTQALIFAAGRGFRTPGVEATRLRLGERFAGIAALERRTVSLPDLTLGQMQDSMRELVAREGFLAYVGVPLLAKGQLQGVFEIFHRASLQSDPEWLEFLETLAGQAAIAIDNATVYADLQRSHADLRLAYDSTLEGWSRALDLRDKETEGHTQRVTELSLRLAQAMGLGPDELVHLRRGALLHDIGKMGVPDYILHKPGPLSDEEWVIMRQHPVFAYEMLLPIAYLRHALDIPYCHHEKWDGTGYPRSLKGESIPLSARIFAVADVYDALRSDRPYRPSWPADQTRAYILEQAGRQFDPRVVDTFAHLP
jgi:PAS domain S-box-containing protein/putative nucleotidyltransferase with HDIG domain